MIVVSFRCTTSAMDWMTNFAAGSSEWELDEDLDQGHAGFCSCFEGLSPYWGTNKPRVHTGFYNNILQCIPLFQEHVDPMLAPDQPARKLYVVGHSLGAGMSVMATIYFLQKHDWKEIPHYYVNISAGTPRSCKKPMAELMDAKLDELRPLDKALACHITCNEDVVTKVPPGYHNFGKLVFLTEDGHVLIGPNLADSHIIDEKEMKGLCKDNPQLRAIDEAAEEKEKEEKAKMGEKILTKYEETMQKIPRPFRDHCPDFYLGPLVKLYDMQQ